MPSLLRIGPRVHANLAAATELQAIWLLWIRALNRSCLDWLAPVWNWAGVDSEGSGNGGALGNGAPAARKSSSGSRYRGAFLVVLGAELLRGLEGVRLDAGIWTKGAELRRLARSVWIVGDCRRRSGNGRRRHGCHAGDSRHGRLDSDGRGRAWRRLNGDCRSEGDGDGRPERDWGNLRDGRDEGHWQPISDRKSGDLCGGSSVQIDGWLELRLFR